MALTLKTALATAGHTAPLKDGSVVPEGIVLEHEEVTPIIAAFRRMVRATEFDICEMSPTTYLTAKAFNKPFTAIPVFLSRMFHNNAIVFREDSGIKAGQDLDGKKVGVRAYTVATGVWVRGILQSEYFVHLDEVTWVTDDEEHVTEFVAPSNVVKAPQGRSLVEMLLAGELDASFTGAAGVGRAGAPGAGWDAAVNVEDQPGIKRLMPDVGVMEVERFKRASVYPIHGLVVVKDELLAKEPWVGPALFNAFKAAKQQYLDKLKADGPSTPQDEAVVARQKIVGADHIPYGVKANRRSLETMIQCAYDQQLTPRKYTVEEIFAPNTLDLE